MSSRYRVGGWAGGRIPMMDLAPRIVSLARLHHSRTLFAVLVLAATVAGPGLMSPAIATAGPCTNAAPRTGPSARLPDCRAYEQVSPPDKNGTDALLTGDVAPEQASSKGSSVVYMSLSSFAGSSGSELPNAYLSTRNEDGWQTRGLTPPTPQATPPGIDPLDYEFSADLSQFVLSVPFQNLTPGVLPEAPAGVRNLYLGHTDGSYSLVTTAPPSVSPPANCGECFITKDLSVFAGASSDFSHVIFEANEGLLGTGAPSAPVDSLYESSGGQVRLVGILPDGAIAAGGSEPGAGIGIFYSAVTPAASQSVNHAISLDGSHIVFQAAADGGVPDPAQSGLTELYDRINGSSTIEISIPAEGATPANTTPEPARFWAASADGSLVFFTSSAELTTQSNTGTGNTGQDLYQYNVATRTLTDLTVDSNPVDAADGADVQGVVGTAEDGSYIYFVAKGQLEPGKGVDGQPSLYESHAGQLSFIATLSGDDAHDWSLKPGELQSYVPPDGRHLAFMSVNSLTGYDNSDLRTHEADSEVYEYSAESGGLACASCNPGGVRPVGSAFIGKKLDAWASTPFYQPRTLSDDGSRVFFSSPDALTPGPASPYVKVFEYEDGGVHPLSSGTSGSDDYFLDASPDGSEVFFATRQALMTSDQDELLDVYVARVGGGFASPPAPAPCAGSVCQGPPSTPPLLPSDISSTFTGAGNLPAPAASPPPTKAKKPKARRKPRKKPMRKRHKSRKARRAVAVNHHRSR
jgi:hypothetical protein